MQQFFLRLSCVLVFVGSIASNVLQAQVGIGTATPNQRSMLHIVATDRGLTLPNATTATIDANGAGPTPAGTITYDTGNLFYWDGLTWNALNSGSTGVNFNVTATQSATNATRFLFDVRNTGNGNVAGARIQAVPGGANRDATGLTIVSTATGTGTATGLTVGATGGSNNYAALFTAGNVGIGVATPTARLQLGAGTTAVGGAPLKLTMPASLTTVAEVGAIETDGTDLFFTKPGPTRVNLSGGGVSANNTLSNLGATAINANLSFAAGTNRIIGIASPTVTGAGNSVTLQAAAANTDGVGGAVNITAGNANSTGAAVSGGSVNITGGNAATGPGGGGSIVLTGGNDGSGLNAAGSIVMVPGTAVGGGRQGGVAIGSGVSIAPADFMVIRPTYTPEGASTYMVQIDPSNTTVNGANFGIALRVSGAFAGSGTGKYAAAFENGGVGIGNLNPALGLDISTGIGLRPGTGAAGATITIPANTSAFTITDDAASAANAITVTGPQNGQLLTIYNADAQAATLGALTVPAVSGGNPGVSTFAFISGAWRLVSTNGASGGGVGWTNPAGFVNLSTTTDNVGIGVAGDLLNKTFIQNAAVTMGGAGITYSGLRSRVVTASTTVAADTLVGNRTVVKLGAGIGVAAAHYMDVSHSGTSSGMAGTYGVLSAPNGAGATGTVYSITAGGIGGATGMSVDVNRPSGAGSNQGYVATFAANGSGNTVGFRTSFGGNSSGSFTGLDADLGGTTSGVVINTGARVNVNTTNASGTNKGLDVVVSGGITNYAATFQGGNVGIGTANPQSLLQVQGGNIAQVVTGNGNPAFLSYGGSTTLLIGRGEGSLAAPTAAAPGSNLGAYRMRPFDGTGYNGGVEIAATYTGAVNATATNSPASLSFGTTPAGSGTISTRMTIADNGNVGIGIAPTGNLLAINGNLDMVGSLRNITFDASSATSTLQVGTTASGDAGTLTLRSGTSVAAGSGGSIQLLAGNGEGAAKVGGAVQIQAGNNATGPGGVIYLTTGNGSTAANAGVIQANIHNRGTQGGAATPSIASGTFTPSTAGSSALLGISFSAGAMKWQRVGNIVNVVISLNVTPTGAGTGNILLTLPTSGSMANFSDINAGSGVLISNVTSNISNAIVTANGGAQTLIATVQTFNTTTTNLRLSFQYEVQ